MLNCISVLLHFDSSEFLLNDYQNLVLLCVTVLASLNSRTTD